MSDGAWAAVVLLVLVLIIAVAMALSGKTVKLDTGCYLSTDNGCIPGKPYRLEDDH